MSQNNQVIQQEETLEGGSYEVILNRLIAQGDTLREKANALNVKRKETFGGLELEVVAQGKVRTQQNCVPRDIISVDGSLMVGYHVPRGLKQEVPVEAVLGLYRFNEEGGDAQFTSPDEALVGELLGQELFIKDFNTLHRYYNDASLAQLIKSDTHILAIFEIGAGRDRKIFEWEITSTGDINYVGNRGRHEFPPAYDFTWKRTTREQNVYGEHPHVNIEDLVFVETVGGDLTVKVDNNTSDGWGIYREPVNEQDQTLDDAEYYYAILGVLVLLKIKPHREEQYRYLVFNTRTQHVVRIDAIDQACVQLPQDHGIIFPGGYYLQSGDYKVFDGNPSGLIFKRRINSPNGEDVLYIFYDPIEGLYVLLSYNLIRKEVESPIRCNGFSLFDNGRMVVFRAHDEPSKLHPMQVWQTSYTSVEYAAAAPTDGSFISKIGNAELVNGISDCLSIARLSRRDNPSRETFEDLIAALKGIPDAYHWLRHEEVGGVHETVAEMRRTAELIIDEFEKVTALKARAVEALAEAEGRFEVVTREAQIGGMRAIEDFMAGMTALRQLRGQLITVREVRYIDLGRLDELEADVAQRFDDVSRACVDFLIKEDALGPLRRDLEALLAEIEAVDKVAEIEPKRARLVELSGGLDLLTEVIGGLQIDDATARTQILEGISETFGQLNRVRATLEARRKRLMSAEGRAEFGVQFKLFGQSVASALAMADTPEACDEALSKVMLQLQELEGRFSEFDEFIGDLAAKREDTYEAFSARKQTLLDARNKRIGNIEAAAKRILEGIGRRARGFEDEDSLNAYFASDAMILKLRDLAEQLSGLGDTVKSEELLGKLKGARNDALRGLRDQLELFEGGGDLIRFGSHQFTVNTQPLELTMVPRGEEMMLHLTGTDFYELIDDEAFRATKPYWAQTVVSEDAAVYRGEYLAATILFDAEAGREGLSMARLHDAQREGQLLEITRERAQARYDEGYERGLHDVDAAEILDKLVAMTEAAGLLRFPPGPRAVAAMFWGVFYNQKQKANWHRKARSLGRIKRAYGHPPALTALAETLAEAITRQLREEGLERYEAHAPLAARYLVEELAEEHPRFTTNREAQRVVETLERQLEDTGERRAFDEDLRALGDDLSGRLELCLAWIDALGAQGDEQIPPELALEAALVLGGPKVDRRVSSASTRERVKGLLGQHPRVQDQAMDLQLDEFTQRLTRFTTETVGGFKAYRKLRAQVVVDARARLRIDEFMPRVMSSFVRNKLINDVYLQLIGDNFAKQMGAAGAKKRTDLMGLLLLISPPGYGKTTLMEYCAHRLGLVFMKVNGPSLGHDVVSLDPSEAPNATARQEVEKINLALEMGNNVMLYLDDIQHTHPELLQKFISLCDAQRKIEGVWRGKTRTYDMRGKKFCVVMAGNPYTETGARFTIPDMLANRADVYNLGDVLEGRDEAFSLSYIENALTSNATLQPLAMRDQSDTYKLIRMARGEEVPGADLKHDYSAVEMNEITSVLRRLLRVQEVVLKVNLQYIASAAVDEAFRVEPAFKLQGSYRNMNKLAEKVVPALNDDEVEALIDDHYTGESQTLTSGGESNLLKLAELRGRLSPEQAARWEEVKRSFRRVQRMGSGDGDPMSRAVSALSSLGEQLELIQEALSGERQRANAARMVAAIEQIGGALQGQDEGGVRAALSEAVARLSQAIPALSRPQVDVTVSAPKGVEELLAQQVALVERTLVPVVESATSHLHESGPLMHQLGEVMFMLKQVERKLTQA